MVAIFAAFTFYKHYCFSDLLSDSSVSLSYCGFSFMVSSITISKAAFPSTRFTVSPLAARISSIFLQCKESIMHGEFKMCSLQRHFVNKFHCLKIPNFISVSPQTIVKHNQQVSTKFEINPSIHSSIHFMYLIVNINVNSCCCT